MLFQLFVFFYKAKCRKITKSSMSEMGALNFRLLFAVISFSKVYMQLHFIELHVSLYFFRLTVLLILNVDMLLKETNLSIEGLVSFLKINLNDYFVNL